MARELVYPKEMPQLPRVKINQHLSRAVTSVTSTSVTLTDDDHIVLVDDDTAGSEVTINLPAASSSHGNIYTIKKLGTTANVTIDPNGSETIDGNTTLTVSIQYDAPKIYCNGTNWFLI